MHKQYPVLRKGSLRQLMYGYNIMAYGRFSPDEQIAVIINNRDEETDVEVPVWELGMDCIHDKVMEQVFYTDAEGFRKEKKSYPVVAGILGITMPPRGAVVLYRKE